ncbi:MAG: hypothetical protein ACOCUU_03220 [Nanoarchaeota archaeon]
MTKYWIISISIGLIILYFFPEPQTNFIYYFLTALAFIVLTIILYKKESK